MSDYRDVMLMFNNSAQERKYGVALDISYIFSKNLCNTDGDVNADAHVEVLMPRFQNFSSSACYKTIKIT